MNRISGMVACLMMVTTAHAQLLNGYNGDEPGAKSWTIDVNTGEFEEGGAPVAGNMASDPATGIIYSVRERYGRDDPVDLQIRGVAGAIPVIDSNGFIMLNMTALAYGDGVLYGFGRNDVLFNYGLGTIDVETGVFTYLFLEEELGGFVTGLTYDHDRDELLMGMGSSIYALNPVTGAQEFVVSGGSFDGLAYGNHRIYMVCGNSGNCPDITVYNRATESFEADLPLPPRTGNGSSGATFDFALLPPAEVTCSVASAAEVFSGDERITLEALRLANGTSEILPAEVSVELRIDEAGFVASLLSASLVLPPALDLALGPLQLQSADRFPPLGGSFRCTLIDRRTGELVFEDTDTFRIER